MISYLLDWIINSFRIWNNTIQILTTRWYRAHLDILSPNFWEVYEYSYMTHLNFIRESYMTSNYQSQAHELPLAASAILIIIKNSLFNKMHFLYSHLTSPFFFHQNRHQLKLMELSRSIEEAVANNHVWETPRFQLWIDIVNEMDASRTLLSTFQ